MKRKQQIDLENAAEKQRLKQLCKDFQTMIKTEDGARYFVFMMECYNLVDIDSFIEFVSDHVRSLLEEKKYAESEAESDWCFDSDDQPFI